MSTTLNLNSLLEKTSHYDKDERYMATSDLCNALTTIQIDEGMEKKICTAILKQLDDKSNDVQSMAVKCLGTLLKRVQQAQVSEICVKLCTLILQGPNELRDIYSIGLKTLIADVPESMGGLVVERSIERLMVGINHDNDDVKRESLDNMTDLLKRFGHLMKSHHEQILSIVVPRLESKKSIVRKRASVCLGALAVVVSDSLLFTLVNDLLTRIDSLDIHSRLTPELADDIRIIIQTIGTISKTVGFRLGKSLDRIIPLFIKCCGGTNDSEMNESQEAFFNDLRENCFPGLESFVLRCSNEIVPHIPAILLLSIHYMKYDPNYCYDDNEGEEDEEEEEDDEDEYGGSDDDDSSWKIRKASIKVMQAIVISRVEILQQNDLFMQIFDELVGRLKEREESVRLEIVNCLTVLFSTALRYAGPASTESDAKSGFPPLPTLSLQKSSENERVPSAFSLVPGQELNSEIVSYLQTKISTILRLSRKQLASPTLKNKSAIYKMLEEFVKLLQGSFEEELPTLLGDIVKYMGTERTETVKYSAILFLQSVFHNHPPLVLQQHLPLVLPVVVRYCRDDWYKITTASLKLLEYFLAVLNPSDSMEVVSSFDFSTLVPSIYQVILVRLEATDLDHEIKDSAISCASQFLVTSGLSISQQERDTLVGLLQKRLDNELLRVTALKAFIVLSTQPALSLLLSSKLNVVVNDIALYLKQNNRVLKQVTLLAILQILNSQFTNQTTDITLQTIQVILREILPIFGETDLHIIDTTLQIVQLIFRSYSSNENVLSTIHSDVLPRIYDLACSSWIYGVAQKSLIVLLQLFISSNLSHFTFLELEDQLVGHFESLLSAQTGTAGTGSFNLKQRLTNLAQCVASICISSSIEIQHQTITKYIAIIEKDANHASSLTSITSLTNNKYFSLLCLGFLGQYLDIRPILSSSCSSQQQLEDILFGCLLSDSDDMKSIISHTLGSLSIGNMSYYLPLILTEIQKNPEPTYQYHILLALRDILVIVLKEKLSLDCEVDNILNHLIPYLSSEEESVRNILSECFGYLTVLYSTKLILLMNDMVVAQSSQLTSSPSPATVNLILTLTNSMKYFFSRTGSQRSLEPLPSFQPFIDMLVVEDLEIKKSVVQMINSAVHYNATLIRDYLTPVVVEQILAVLALKCERVIDLGPFKHRIDDALPLRKTALTCCETILAITPRTMDSRRLLESLIRLLNDNKDETNLQCHQILCKLCDCDEGALLCVLDQVIDPLEKSMTKNLTKEQSGGSGDAAAGPEIERAHEQLRSCVRFMKRVNNITDITLNRRWQDFLSKMTQKPSIVQMMNNSE